MTANGTVEPLKGRVFDIQRWSLHDGPGIRTVVFLKGCPLRCLWCSNPESQEYRNEIAFFRDKCISCFRCVALCPHNAISIEDNLPSINREICKATCYEEGVEVFPCTGQCYSKALRAVAKLQTVEEVMKEVMKDEGIYRESVTGGVTVSGGEPMSQAEFVLALFVEARRNRITTALETCGQASWQQYQEVIPYTDYLFYDIKAYDPVVHKKLMGVDNHQILENARKISKLTKEVGAQMIVRIPVVPPLTETEDFTAILDFIKQELQEDTAVELMPYHRLGRNKYRDMGQSYALMDLDPCSEENLKSYRSLMEGYAFPNTSL